MAAAPLFVTMPPTGTETGETVVTTSPLVSVPGQSVWMEVTVGSGVHCACATVEKALIAPALHASKRRARERW
jgi:hypothetical protein